MNKVGDAAETAALKGMYAKDELAEYRKIKKDERAAEKLHNKNTKSLERFFKKNPNASVADMQNSDDDAVRAAAAKTRLAQRYGR